MRVDIKTSGLDLTDGLRDHAQKRLEFALDWARHDVRRVSINLSDINGPRGGKDKRCQIHIPLPGHRDVVIQDTESDLYAAIDLAADRAGQTLERRLCRHRDTSINHGRSLSRLSKQSDSTAV
jgi:putative sigma-54 modulation protein